MTPSNANTSGLEVVQWEYRTAPHRQWHITDSKAVADQEAKDGSEVVPRLARAASAQARIAELVGRAEKAEREAGLIGSACDKIRINTSAEIRQHMRRATAAEARADRLAKALERIERWFGEFPETGRNWQNVDGSDSDRPMPYGAVNGSNGERDYMRSVARAALQQEG